MTHPFGLTLAALEAALNSEPIIQDVQDDGSTGDRSNDDTLIATTLALGEEGGGITDSLTEGGDATTEALGEEGGDYTTMAFGEEGGDVTTLALGEEGGFVCGTTTGEGDVTTLALGEEGGFVCGTTTGEDGWVTSQALGEEGGMTTLAVGEEGGDIFQPIESIIPGSENLG